MTSVLASVAKVPLLVGEKERGTWRTGGGDDLSEFAAELSWLVGCRQKIVQWQLCVTLHPWSLGLAGEATWRTAVNSKQ